MSDDLRARDSPEDFSYMHETKGAGSDYGIQNRGDDGSQQGGCGPEEDEGIGREDDDHDWCKVPQGEHYCEVPIFLWKGQNYLNKMRHDLSFIDDPALSYPVCAWLGFSAHDNPFLIPSGDNDVSSIPKCNQKGGKAFVGSQGISSVTDSSMREESISSGVIEREAHITLSTPSLGDEREHNRTESLSDAVSGESDFSVGSAEEIRWDEWSSNDGSSIIPPVPETIRRRALVASEIIRLEPDSKAVFYDDAELHFHGFSVQNSAFEGPGLEPVSRVEILRAQSARRGLRNALRERHVGVPRVCTLAAGQPRERGEPVRPISTAPSLGEHTRRPIQGVPRAIRTGARQHGTPFMPADEQAGGLGGISTGEGFGLDSTSGTISGRCWTSSIESDASLSLKASVSNMLARARMRDLSCRPTVIRRDTRGRQIVLSDPTKKEGMTDRAASLIQAAFLGIKARRFVTSLRRKVEWAAGTIARVWRGSKARSMLRTARISTMSACVGKRMEEEGQGKAAHSMTTFFRDIVDRKRQVRMSSESNERFATPSTLNTAVRSCYLIIGLLQFMA